MQERLVPVRRQGPQGLDSDRPYLGRLTGWGLATGRRSEAAISFLVTPDLIRGPFTQRGKNGSRIKSGMTNV
ncbi:protein of unknown function [uncultured Sphingopyxis sp.]|uniref:Uncharacterized protein n=1 Tax=uncultured Sphingopyxis sp. TaxID=310581 RepID=A0A1Y5PV13_9SPHN|nr:protein of unknown function [uncultured Sphingopyxis sp.]